MSNFVPFPVKPHRVVSQRNKILRDCPNVPKLEYAVPMLAQYTSGLLRLVLEP